MSISIHMHSDIIQTTCCYAKIWATCCTMGIMFPNTARFDDTWELLSIFCYIFLLSWPFNAFLIGFFSAGDRERDRLSAILPQMPSIPKTRGTIGVLWKFICLLTNQRSRYKYPHQPNEHKNNSTYKFKFYYCIIMGTVTCFYFLKTRTISEILL